MAPTAAEVSKWSTAQVCAFLDSIGLGALKSKAEDAEVTGEDLITLTPSEIKVDLNITKLQAKKIKRALEGADPSGDALADDAHKLSLDHGAEPPKVDTSHTDDHTSYAAIQSSTAIKATAAEMAGRTVTGSPVVIQLDGTLVDTWTQKTTLIRQLEADQVSVKLPAAQERLAYLKQKLAEERKKFNELKEINNELTKKYKELEEGSWYPGKFVMGKHKRNEKVEKAEQQADEAARKLESAGKVLEDLAAKVADQEKAVLQLNGQVSQLIEAKNWEAQTLVQAFGGAAGDTKENQLEGEVAALVPQVEQTRRYKMSYSKAYEHVRAARKQFEGALQLFQSAFGLANFDVMQDFLRPMPFHNSPMGMAADIAKRAQCNQAQQLVGAAIVSLERAFEIIPDMPRVKKQDVQNLRGMGIFAMVFDNIISDLAARRSIQEAMQKLQAMLNDVTYVERWLQGWLSGRIDQDLARLEQSYAAKKGELDAYRRSLLQSAASAKSAASAASAGPAAYPVVPPAGTKPLQPPSLI